MDAKAVPNVAVPGAGERFSNEELRARYGVPMSGGIRISEENRCMVLVDRARPDQGQASGGRGAYILYTGQDSDGGSSLSRSKEEGYTGPLQKRAAHWCSTPA